jgi:hypothetical protein
VDKQEKPELRAKEVPVKKPKRKNGTRRGYFVPSNPEKYEGKVDQIIYRSKIELRMMKYLDSHPSVLKWSSEEVVVPYVKPTDGKVHRYFVDFKVQRKTKTGEIKTALVEVKWSTATVPPKVPKRKTRRYLNEQTNWIINQAKWDAAKKVCENRGWEWLIMTEKQLSY